MTADRPGWAVRLFEERTRRGWSQKMMASRLREAADERARGRMPSLASLKKYVSEHEAGKHFPRDYAELYCRVFGMTRTGLFGATAGFGSESASVDIGVADAANLTAWIESTNTSDDAVASLDGAVIEAAGEHSCQPPATVLVKVWRLHKQVEALLHDGRQRLRQTRELLRLDAGLLAHVCLLLGDLSRDEAAIAYGTAAMVAADEAGSSAAAAFSAQAQIARWRHRYASAADLAAQGFACSPATSLRVLLASQEANAAALTRHPKRARAALARAESAAVDGELDSAWSCPAPRLALYRLGVALHLGEPREALRQAALAERAWAADSRAAFGSRAHVRIGAGIAYLMLGSVDGAAEQINPVLSLPREYRLATVTEHMVIISALLRWRRFRGSREAAVLHEQINEFTRSAAAVT